MGSDLLPLQSMRLLLLLLIVAVAACQQQTGDDMVRNANADPVPADASDSTDSPDAEDAARGDASARPSSISFETVLDVLPHEFVFDPAEDPLGMGSGGGLLDYDGDDDFDLFLGDSPGGSPACLYRNDSSPGVLSFAPIGAVCDHSFPRPVRFAVGVGDNAEELLLAGSRLLMFFDPGTGQATDLLGDLEFDDARRRCEVSAIREVDLDGDGINELYVGCGHAAHDTDARKNIVFARAENGWRAWDTETAGALANAGASLAVVVLESASSTSLFLANDSFSSPNQRNVLDVPGTWLDRSTRDNWEPSPLTDAPDAFGSFMGGAVLDLAGRPTMLLTDWGPVRAVDLETREVTPFPMGFDWGPTPLFSWSALPYDFDGNGHIDIYVTLGHIRAPGSDDDRTHEDVLLLGYEDGFRRLGRSELAPADPRPFRSSRAAVLVDFDGDELPEVLTIPLQGPPILDRIVAPEPSASSCAQDAPAGRTSIGRSGWAVDLGAQPGLGTPPTSYARGEACPD